MSQRGPDTITPAACRRRYLFTTHDLGVVADIADRVGLLKNGKLVECADAAQIITSPQEEYTRMLIEAVPAFSA